MNNDINNFYSLPGVQSDTTMVVSGDTITHSPQNAGLRVEFFIAYEPNQIETIKAGGILKTSPVECIKIRQTGDDLTAAVHKVTEEIKQRFPQEYKNWTDSKNNDFVSGTPLSDWEMIDGGMVQEMASAGVRSVENLAAISDSNISRFMNGHLWRKKAQMWLEDNKINGPTKLLEAKNKELMARLEKLEALIQNGSVNPLDGERMDEMKKSRGRPRKEIVTEETQEQVSETV
jgi:hypothetical protein